MDSDGGFCGVPEATILRLPLYLEKLKLLQNIGVEDVSSRQLAEALDLKASQLRHDFHYFGGFSSPGRPYRVGVLVTALQRIIGVDQPVPTAIVGAGHLGQALANYQGLPMQGFPIRGIFDINPRLHGLEIFGQPIRDLDELEPVCRREGIKIGVVTVPASSAQDVANMLIDAGVTGIMNFAPTELRVPQHVSVRHERLSVGFMALSFRVKYGVSSAAAEDGGST